MTALLATEGITLRAHFLKHVAIAYRGGDHGNSLLLHCEAEAEVGHHCRHDGVACQRAAVAHAQSEDRQDLIAINDVTFGIDSKAAIGVAVVGYADVRAVLQHGSDEIVEVRAAASLIDVETVRRGMNGHHVGACATHRLGRDRRCRAVGAIDHDG